MVTTRSADKQAGSSEKEDRLALRSKSEETRPSVSHPESEIATPISSTTRTKVLVNVPPSKKRTRASLDGTDNIENTMSPSEGGLLETSAEQIMDGRSEIPDSQESPLKPVITLNPEQQLESNLLAHIESLPDPSSAPKTVKERSGRLPEAVPLAHSDYIDVFADDADETTEGRHRRFDSEGLAGEQGVGLAIQAEVPIRAAAALSDEDGAPEVVTSKKAVSSVSQSQRKSKAKKPAVKASRSETKAPLPAATISGVNTSDFQGEEIVTSTTTPSLKIDVSQIDNSKDMLASDDSGDSAFVTARTTRHVDFFTTPLSSKAYVRSPMFKNTVTKLDEITEEDSAPVDGPVTNLSAGLRVMDASIPDTLPRGEVRRSLVLPRKANNTLEHYRRQTLSNRAAKSTANGSRGNFRLTEDWPAKRRKFVVGY